MKEKIVQIILKWALLLSGVYPIFWFMIFTFGEYIPPESNFTIFRLILLGGFGLYGLFVIVCLLIALIIATALSIKQNRIVLPILCCSFYFLDLITAGYLFVSDLVKDNFFNDTALTPGIIDIILIMLFSFYFAFQIKNRKKMVQESKIVAC